MGHIKWDTSEVDALGVDLSGAPGRMQRKAPKVFEVGANKIKQGMKALARGHNYLSGLSGPVSYDKLSPLHYEIGFDKVGQGNLANIAAYGSVNNAPVMDHTIPLRVELPKIAEHLLDAGEESVLGGDGR